MNLGRLFPQQTLFPVYACSNFGVCEAIRILKLIIVWISGPPWYICSIGQQ